VVYDDCAGGGVRARRQYLKSGGRNGVDLRRRHRPITLEIQSTDTVRVLAPRRPSLAPRPSFLFEAAMRLSPALLCLAIAVVGSAAEIARAQDESYQMARMNARRELELAKIEFRDYWQVEYPRIRRDLDARIELTEAEIRNYKERLRLYLPFDRFSTGGALVLPLQDLRMCLLEAELRLRDLWAERGNLIRFRTPEWRVLELRLHDARVRVADLEAQADNFGDGA
jgi:hypothetical protein